jgi:hypothetical protein
MPRAEVAAKTSTNTGTMVIPSHRLRKSAARGAANAIAKGARQVCDDRQNIAGRKTPNQGARAIQLRSNGRNVVSHRGVAVLRPWVVKPINVTTKMARASPSRRNRNDKFVCVGIPCGIVSQSI